MAVIIGGVGTTHVPSIGKAIAERKYKDPYWSPFFKGFDYVHSWLAREKPDVAVVFYNDHGLNFFLDKMPTFAVGAAALYCNEDEGWGIPVARAIPGDPALSWHLINALVAEEFDITMCQEMLVDHAVTIPMALMWPGENWPIRIVPVAINTVQHPLPSPKRCLNLGRAIGRAIETYPGNLRVMIVGTGGLSHQLDGKRAGFINTEFDQYCMDKIVHQPDMLARLGRGSRRARRRISQLDGDARRTHRSGVGTAPQLSRPDLEHRRRHGGAWEPRGPTARGRVTADLVSQ
jgi:protocatechuate 4,5-dioxygenase, beta chain